MLTEYIEQALTQAQVEKMEDGRFFACLPEFKGVWAAGDTSEKSLEELRSALEEWLVIALREDDKLPDLAGVSLNFGVRRWLTAPPGAGQRLPLLAAEAPNPPDAPGLA